MYIYMLSLTHKLTSPRPFTPALTTGASSMVMAVLWKLGGRGHVRVKLRQ